MSKSRVRLTVRRMIVAVAVLGGVAADEPKTDVKAEVRKLQGVWRPQSVTANGKEQEGIGLETFRGMTLTIDGKKGILKAAADATISIYEMTFDASKDPKTFDGKEVEGLDVGGTIKGVWKVDGDTLFWCFSNKERPKGFESKPDSTVIMMVQKRQKPK
jgi:uncharacterized protein (TIGR03067 family)